MTENVYSKADDMITQRATWALNSLLESGDDHRAAELAAELSAELERELRRAA